MHGTQTIVLSELVSTQPAGIMLVFSEYSSGTPRDYGWQHRPVARDHVTTAHGTGIFFPMRGTTVAGMKYLYVHDDKIVGNSNNDQNGNNTWVLRRVLGV